MQLASYCKKFMPQALNLSAPVARKFRQAGISTGALAH